MMTAYATEEAALEAMKAGAYDYLTKPFKPDEVVVLVRGPRRRSATGSPRENRRLREPERRRAGPAGIVGASEPMQDVLRHDREGRAAEATVLITGESGTGKELVARALHEPAARREAVRRGQLRRDPGDAARVRALRPRAGAFTGATRDKKRGAVRGADGGTLFLDEIGELPPPAGQAPPRPAGGGDPPVGGRARKVDVRVVAATNRDLRPRGRRGPLPRGPLLPAERAVRSTCRRCASAPRTSRCSPSTSSRGTRALRPELAGRSRPRRRALARLPLAGERPRARERDRARGGARRGPGHRRESSPTRSAPRHARAPPTAGAGATSRSRRDARRSRSEASAPRSSGPAETAPRGGAARDHVPGAALQDQGLRAGARAVFIFRLRPGPAGFFLIHAHASVPGSYAQTTLSERGRRQDLIKKDSIN